MNATKSLLSLAVLAACGTANATTWDITMSGSSYFPGVGGNLISTGIPGTSTSFTPSATFTGTWDDVTGAGQWTGRTYSAGTVALDTEYHQTFTMPTATSTSATYGDPKQGTLNAFDVPTCHDNISGLNGAASSGCAGFSGPLSGDLFNTVAGNASGNNVNNAALKIPVAFTGADGAALNWTLQAYQASGTKVTFLPLLMNVTLHCHAGDTTGAGCGVTPPPTPEVPVPAAAWLFGSGLLGLAGTARRRRNSTAA